MPPVRIQCWQQFADIPLSREQWNALAQRNETNSVFQTHEWHQSWWETFGDRNQLFFLTAQDGTGTVIGFAPLMLQMGRGKAHLMFIADGNSDYLDFVIPDGKESVLPQFLDFIRAHAHLWGRCTFNNIPASSTTHGAIDHYCEHHGLYRCSTETICPTLRITGNREAVLRTINKYSLRRPQHYFERHGSVRFRRLTDAEEAARLLPLFFDQHIARRRLAGSASLFNDVLRQQLYSRALTLMLPLGWVHFSVVEVDDKPLAFHFGFDYNGCLLWYKPSFDPAFARHSPGLLLIRHLIMNALDTEKDELDFTIGNEAFKDRFANLWRSNISISVFSSPLRYRANWLERQLVKQIKRIDTRARELTRRWTRR